MKRQNKRERSTTAKGVVGLSVEAKSIGISANTAVACLPHFLFDIHHHVGLGRLLQTPQSSNDCCKDEKVTFDGQSV